MPSVVFVIGFALLAFAYDLCAQGCVLPFRSPPCAAHRVRPRSPLEGVSGIESFGGYITVFLFGILPQRYRVRACQALLLPVHIHYHLLVGGFLFRAAVPWLACYNLLFSCVYSLFFGQIVNIARARELHYSSSTLSGPASPLPMRGSILSGQQSLWLLPVHGHTLPSFLYAIRFGSAIAHAWEDSHMHAIGSVLSLPYPIGYS
ncbi:hypothetical protein EDB89DRAFT_1904708 [Lactarius sanguifluus]|nr:hypothetical protein EDB89DRAFT_1904708 [Lactarius sanguifluus]